MLYIYGSASRIGSSWLNLKGTWKKSVWIVIDSISRLLSFYLVMMKKQKQMQALITSYWQQNCLCLQMQNKQTLSPMCKVFCKNLPGCIELINMLRVSERNETNLHWNGQHIKNKWKEHNCYCTLDFMYCLCNCYKYLYQLLYCAPPLQHTVFNSPLQYILNFTTVITTSPKYATLPLILLLYQ